MTTMNYKNKKIKVSIFMITIIVLTIKIIMITKIRTIMITMTKIVVEAII